MVCDEQNASLCNGGFRIEGLRRPDEDFFGDTRTMVLWAVRRLVEKVELKDDNECKPGHFEGARWVLESDGFKPGMGDDDEERTWRHAMEQEVFQAELALLIVAESGDADEAKKDGESCPAFQDASAS